MTDTPETDMAKVINSLPKIEIVQGENNAVAEFFSSPSETPETDRNAVMLSCVTDYKWVPEDFARKLERERDEWRKAAFEITSQANKLKIQLKSERDEARDLADRYRIAYCSVNGVDKATTPFPWEKLQNDKK